MNTATVHCFISPHSDDIAFSAMGGLLRLPKNTRKMLITVFTESCWTFYAAPQRDQWKEVTAMRLEEDKQFIKLFDCEYIHFTLADSSLRYYSEGQEYHVLPMNDPIFSEVVEHLKQLLAKLPTDTLFYVPLGIGEHVDHLIVRTAMINLLPDLQRLVFYEDLPYAYYFTDVEIAAMANSVDNRLLSQLIDMEDFWPNKAQAIHIYLSQLESHTYPRIEAYASRIGVDGHKGERLWSSGDVEL